MPSVRILLAYGYNELQHLEIPSLDTEVLLSFVLDKPREYILAHGEDEVSGDKIEQFKNLVARRSKHEPIAYLVKQKEFYGRPFYVDERAHIPRPGTEDLIDYVKKIIPKDFSGTLADIGTGSGCIAITLALEFPKAKIIATDISADALAVARRNIPRQGDRIIFYQGNLLSPLTEAVDIIVSNPPYGWVGDWSHDSEVFYQPKKSYDGGADGLAVIRKLLTQLPRHLKPGGQAVIELDPRQSDEIKILATKDNWQYQIIKDSAGFDRLIHLRYN